MSYEEVGYYKCSVCGKSVEYCIYNNMELYERSVDACVTVTTNGGLNGGSGFFVRKDGYIVTNAHVVLENGGINPGDKPLNNILVRTKNLNGEKDLNRVVSCEVEGYDPPVDLAVLKVKSSEEDPIYGFDVTCQKYLRWEHVCELKGRNGERVMIIGNLGLANHVGLVTGVISDMRYHIAGHETVITTAVTHPGSSGAAMINTRGRAIAMNGFSVLDRRGNRISSASGGSNQHTVEHIMNNIINGHKGEYKLKGFLGASELFPLTTSIIYLIVQLVPNFVKVSNGQGYIIAAVDNTNVTPGRGLLNAKPTPLRQFDILTSIGVKGKKIYELGSDGKDLYTPAHVTYVNPPGTKVEVQFLRPGETKKRTSYIVMDDYPVYLNVVNTNAQSIEQDEETEKRIAKEFKKFHEKLVRK